MLNFYARALQHIVNVPKHMQRLDSKIANHRDAIIRHYALPFLEPNEEVELLCRLADLLKERHKWIRCREQ